MLVVLGHAQYKCQVFQRLWTRGFFDVLLSEIIWQSEYICFIELNCPPKLIAPNLLLHEGVEFLEEARGRKCGIWIGKRGSVGEYKRRNSRVFGRHGCLSMSREETDDMNEADHGDKRGLL